MAVTVLQNADVLTVDENDQVFLNGWLVVEDGRISAVGPSGDAPRSGGSDTVIDLKGHLLLPGFVNAHTHSPMVLFRGRAEAHSLLTMEGWREAIREPELSLEKDDIAPAAMLSYAEMVSGGTTTVADQYFFAESIADAARAFGIRAVIAYGIVELGDLERGRRELDEAIRFVERTNATEDRVRAWIGPHAPYVDNSEGLLSAEVDAATRYGVGLHLHMAVGPEDNEPTLASHGVTAAVALSRSGFLGARVLAAHCIDLSDADIHAFAEAPMTSVVQCPTAGLRSGRPGITPVPELMDAGVAVALGTDNVAANNSYDVVSEMKMAGLLAARHTGRAGVLPASTLLRMATLNGAKALGMEHEVGSLEPGKAADLVAVDARGFSYSPGPDPATLLVYSGSGRDVRHVMVDGEWLLRDGALAGVDPVSVRREYREVHRAFWDRAGGEVAG
jgi:5-methylthioadenosine/S-adenosylhomocysteine deaminase